jgi:hypothetical protein
MAMGETRRKFDQDFREGAVRLVRETGKPIAQVARDLKMSARRTPKLVPIAPRYPDSTKSADPWRSL